MVQREQGGIEEESSSHDTKGRIDLASGGGNVSLLSRTSMVWQALSRHGAWRGEQNVAAIAHGCKCLALLAEQ